MNESVNQSINDTVDRRVRGWRLLLPSQWKSARAVVVQSSSLATSWFATIAMVADWNFADGCVVTGRRDGRVRESMESICLLLGRRTDKSGSLASHPSQTLINRWAQMTDPHDFGHSR